MCDAAARPHLDPTTAAASRSAACWAWPAWSASAWARCWAASSPRSAPARNAAGAGGVAGVVRADRLRLRVRRAVLRRARRDGADRRQRLHLRLRDAGRVRRLDHRLGSDPRIRDQRGAARPRRGRATCRASSGASASNLPECAARRARRLHARRHRPRALADRPVGDRWSCWRSRRCSAIGIRESTSHQHAVRWHPGRSRWWCSSSRCSARCTGAFRAAVSDSAAAA